MTLDDHKTPPIPCLGCAAPQDGHLSMLPGQTQPQPGNVSICLYCSAIAIYTTTDGRLAFRYPDDKELREILSDPGVTRSIAAIRTMRETHKPIP